MVLGAQGHPATVSGCKTDTGVRGLWRISDREGGGPIEKFKQQGAQVVKALMISSLAFFGKEQAHHLRITVETEI
jgi:hypothetical protein